MAGPSCEWVLFELRNVVYLKIYKNNSERLAKFLRLERGARWKFFQKLPGRVIALNSSCNSNHRFEYNMNKDEDNMTNLNEKKRRKGKVEWKKIEKMKEKIKSCLKQEMNPPATNKRECKGKRKIKNIELKTNNEKKKRKKHQERSNKRINQFPMRHQFKRLGGAVGGGCHSP